jgi:autotransporter-associated beta strand protein
MSRKTSSRNRGPIILAAAAAVAGFSATRAMAQDVLNYSSGSVTQNFSTLSNTGFAPGTSSGTQDIDSSQYGAGGAPMAGWYYYAATDNVYVVETSGGSTSTGGLYAYGTGGTVSAMGLQTTGGSGVETIGLELVNTSGSTLNSFTVSFDDATYHYGDTAGASKTLSFDYDVTSAGAANPSNIPTSGLNATGLNYTATNPTPDTFASAGAYENGINQTLESGTVFGSGGLNWQPNDVLWLEWAITSSTAQSPGIGISNFSFSASDTSAPSVTWNLTGGGNWNDTDADWVGNSTKYADGDNVTFANSITGDSVINVQAGGVAPESVTINNTTGHKYTFQGGSINGTGGLTNTAGTTVLAAANTYSGGTAINGGTVIADGDATLGSDSGPVTFGGGTLQAGAALSSSRSIIVNPGGGTFVTGGFASVTSGGATIGDQFNLTGTGGSLEVDGPINFSNTGALNIGSGTSFIVNSSQTVDQINSSNYDGKLIIEGTPRMNFGNTADTTATFASQAGTGEIDVTNGGTTTSFTTTGSPAITYTTYNTGVAITNASGTAGGVIDVPIKLNSNYSGSGFQKADVTNANPTCIGNFTVTLGGTSAGDGLTINGVISGNSDVNIANAQNDAGGGAGSLSLGAQETYTGTTLINTSGTVNLEVANTLPTTTDVIFGTVSGAEGHNTQIDLYANQQWDSLSSGEFGKNTDELIEDNSFNPVTLTISGAASPTNTFKGTLSDGIGQLALVMDGPGTDGLSSSTSTYSGGTTLNGGTLQITHDFNLGAEISPLTFNGGTLAFLGSNSTNPSDFVNSRSINITTNGGTVDVAPLTTYTIANTPTMTWSGNLTFTDTGTAQLTQTNATAIGTPLISVGSGATLTVAANAVLTVNGNVDPFTDNTGTQPSPNHVAIVNNGSLTVAQVNTTIAGITGTGSLTIGDGITQNTLKLADNGAPSNIGSLSILGNSVLDIGNNKLIIDYTAGNDPISTIQQWIKNGFVNGDEPGTSGPEIISSDIAADDALSGLSYGIGYADGADGVVAGLPSGEIEIMFTLLGDANLDGTVNAEDYTPFSHNIGQSGMYWDDGDFNYDGTVNSEDYTPFSHNIGQFASLASQTAGPLEAANGIASVPEPASISLLTLAGCGMLARRRRKQS